jgi:hypothetical protein
LAFVLLGKSTTRPPEKPQRMAARVIIVICCGVSGYSWNTALRTETTHAAS